MNPLNANRDIAVTTQHCHAFERVLESWMDTDLLREWLAFEAEYAPALEPARSLCWRAWERLPADAGCLMKNGMGPGYAVFSWPGIQAAAADLALPFAETTLVQITLGSNDYGVIQHLTHRRWPDDPEVGAVFRFFREAWPKAVSRQSAFLASFKS